MKRQLSSASSGASSLNGNDELGSADGQVQPPSASASEQSTESSELEGGLLLDSHLAQLLGMRPGERLCRGAFYGSPMASYISALAAQFLDRQEGLLLCGLGEGTSSITQHSMAEYLSMSRYNALAIRALLDSVEAPASVITGEGVSTMNGQSPSASHWQDTNASHWQEPGAPPHWQDPGAPYALAPSAPHLQDPSAPYALAPSAPYGQNPSAPHWQNPSASHWQDTSASHWQDTSASHWQNPSAPHWQDPGAPYGQSPSSPYGQDPSTSYAQNPSASGQSAIDSEAGFMLAPYLASALGMQPGEGLFRGMFHSTQRSHVVLEMINQLSEIQKDLLRNQELERAGVVTQGEISLSFEDTTALIATNEELLQALMASIEAPVETMPPTVVYSSSNSETELKKRALAKLEEEKMKCRVPSREEETRIGSPDPVGEGILRRLMEEEEARYREKVREMKSKSEDSMSQKTIVVEESEEERNAKLAALEETMISHSEVKVREKFSIQEEKEENVGTVRAKNVALSQARKRERKKVAEIKSGTRLVIGSIPGNIMKEIEMRSAAIVKDQEERKANKKCEAVRVLEVVKEAKKEKERIKAAERAERERREAELREAKAKRKAEMRVEKAKLEEEARAARKKQRKKN